MSDETEVAIHFHRSFPTTSALFLFVTIAVYLQSGFIVATAVVLIVFNILQTQRLRKTVNTLMIEVEDAKNSANSYKQCSEHEETSCKQPQELVASSALDSEEIFNMLSTLCRDLFTELVIVLHFVAWFFSPDTQNPNALASNRETETSSKVESEGVLLGTKETSSVEDKPDLLGNGESASPDLRKDQPDIEDNGESTSPHLLQDKPDLQGNVESASLDVDDEPDLQVNVESASPNQLEEQVGLDTHEECHRPSDTHEACEPISTNGFVAESLTFGSFEDTPLFGSSTTAQVDLLQDSVVPTDPQIAETTPSTMSSPKSSIELVPSLPGNLHHTRLDPDPPALTSKTPDGLLPEKVKAVSSFPTAALPALMDMLLPGPNPHFVREIPPSIESNDGKQIHNAHQLKLEDTLKRLSPNNVDKIFQELQDVITVNSKQLTKCANIFVEKAVTEAANQTVVIACAKLISYIVHFPKNGGLKMLAIEISNSLFATLALLLELEFDGQPSCFVMELVTKVAQVAIKQSNNQKLIKGIVRFASELFLCDVLELEELKDRLIDPLLVKRTNKSMEILCQILKCTGHRINRLSTQESNLVNWYSQLFKKLEGGIQDRSFDTEIIQCIQRVIDLKNCGWDPYLKSEKSQEPLPLLVNSIAPAKKKKKKKPKKSNLTEGNLAKAACENAPAETITHGDIAVVSSDNSSIVVSPASSVSSLPGCDLHGKLIVDIDARKVFTNFMVERCKPESSIMQWLKIQFDDCEEKRIRDFVRNVGRLIGNPRHAKDASQIGYLLHLMIKGLIISEDQVIRGLMSGIVSDLPMYHRDTARDFISLNKNAAILVVSCWEERMEDLTWLITLGKHQQKLNKSAWEYFSLAVFNLLNSRVTLEGTRKLFLNTQNREALEFAATVVKISD